MFLDDNRKQLGYTVIALYCVVTGLLIASAIFLADALRRLKQSFSQDNRLVVNYKTMSMHVIALFFYTFASAVC